MPKRTQGSPFRRVRTWISGLSLAIQQPIRGPPLLLGRAPATGIALGWRGSGLASGSGLALPHGRYGGDILAQQSRRICVTAPLGETDHFQDPHRTIERDGYDIAGLHGPARRVYALAIEPHMALRHKRCRRRARAHDARVPQPFVDALAVVCHATIALRTLRPLLVALE